MPRGSTSLTRKSPRIKKTRGTKRRTSQSSKKVAQKKPRLESPPAERYSKTTDSKRVTTPVQKYVHPALALGWTINKSHPMWFIFDGHTPARQFNRNMHYDSDKEYPSYGNPPWFDLTESDLSGSDDALMPYAPASYKSSYYLKYNITADKILRWTDGELRTISVGVKAGKAKKVTYSDHQIPAPYDRIVDQLLREVEHATKAVKKGHEVLRRKTYAQRVLDAFHLEIRKYDGDPASFRSRVLTPLLQRQLCGVEENQGPCVRNSVCDKRGRCTIKSVTQFYLGCDPTDPGWIPTFRRNLVYIPEARWHLGVVLGKISVADHKAYDDIKDHHDQLMRKVSTRSENDDTHEEGGDDGSSEEDSDDDEAVNFELDVVNSAPPFRLTEVSVLVAEGLDEFFAHELQTVPEIVAKVKNERELRRTQQDAATKRSGRRESPILFSSPPPEGHEEQDGDEGGPSGGGQEKVVE